MNPKVYLCYACENGRPEDCSGWCGVAPVIVEHPEECRCVDCEAYREFEHEMAIEEAAKP